jgi:hypothetical protein
MDQGMEWGLMLERVEATDSIQWSIMKAQHSYYQKHISNDLIKG